MPQAYQDDNAGRENNVIPPVKSHRLQIRDGTLKFRLNDGNLRIGRGFGKRNYGADPYVDKWVCKFYCSTELLNLQGFLRPNILRARKISRNSLWNFSSGYKESKEDEAWRLRSLFIAKNFRQTNDSFLLLNQFQSDAIFPSAIEPNPTMEPNGVQQPSRGAINLKHDFERKWNWFVAVNKQLGWNLFIATKKIVLMWWKKRK